ncbi:MAG: redoxin domain-containing protein [Saprospirales bacterium]|nr:redoxin domain-containing protein [Saprospirales bacterium]MBK8923221.1 redoxin domain-containing protein [Saprospirales bacterium]
MRNLYLISTLFFLATCMLRGQAFTVYDSFSELEDRIREVDHNTTLVINFWATWCGPCVEELPCFEELHRNYASADFQVLLVSLDFKSRLEQKFIPFLEKHQLKPEVVLLADQDADNWIPKIHPDWQGALPATVVLRGGQRALFPEKFEHYEDLEAFVLNFVKSVRKATNMGCKGTR